MAEPVVLNIDLQVPKEQFLKELTEAGNKNITEMKVETKTIDTIYSSVQFLELFVMNQVDGSSFIIAAKCIQNKQKEYLHFRPIQLKKLGESFYGCIYFGDTIPGSISDPAFFCLRFLRDQCIAHNGSLSYIGAINDCLVVDNGKLKVEADLAIVTSDGMVYAEEKEPRVYSAVVFNNKGYGVSVNKSLTEWLHEHPQISEACNTYKTQEEKMDCIGHYIMQARLDGNMEQDEFFDILYQIGAFGFSNPSLQKIYKIFME